MLKKVIYTAIFGDKDVLHEPEFLPEGFDFVCFTDNKDLESKVWDIRVVEPLFKDPVRNARYYKIMAHKVLPEYEISVWVDGNMVVTGDVNIWIEKYLKKYFFVTFDHSKQKKRWLGLFWITDKKFARNCIYKEAEDILKKNAEGFYMDHPDVVINQVSRYRNEGYPKNNGLAVTMILLRRHNNEQVINLMESWWQELSVGSRRDQLSLNYVVWKNSFPLKYVKGDPRYNKFFKKNRHKIKSNFRQN